MRAVAGLYVRLGNEIDADVNRRVHALAKALITSRPAGVTDVIPCYATVYVEYETGQLSAAGVRTWAESQTFETAPAEDKLVHLSVHYDGLDLQTVADANGLDPAEVVRRHSAVEYLVYAVGFTPGFPFMGVVDPGIRLPRLTSPRQTVASGTVAIADSQTGIYPLASPGGWRQLGSVRESIYDPHRERPALLEPGDRVRFEPVPGDGNEPTRATAVSAGDPAPLELLPQEPRRPILQVHEPGVLDLIVDAGRFSAGRLGLARSGPLDALSAATANRLVGNPPDASLLEMNVKGPVLELVHDCVVAFAGYGVVPELEGVPVEPFTAHALRAGNTLAFPPQSRGVRGYLAIAGGIESLEFMGSASVDVRGLIGRPLAAGDVLGAAEVQSARPGFSFEPYRRWPPLDRKAARQAAARFASTGTPGLGATTLRLLPGPQPDAAALSALTTHLFRIERADRMGLQLDGGSATQGRPAEAVPGHGILSEANPLGAIQVTPSGQPLILLHDRGTIGGYTKPALLHPGDLAKAGQLRGDDAVRFVPAR